ncbi:hypothetical protein TYRP_003253 [Tyrophagus putrescentiae]|nr:hypothetical protein TYRP_003253 [Tyrophagus putrescentiae]
MLFFDSVFRQSFNESVSGRRATTASNNSFFMSSPLVCFTTTSSSAVASFSCCRPSLSKAFATLTLRIFSDVISRTAFSEAYFFSRISFASSRVPQAATRLVSVECTALISARSLAASSTGTLNTHSSMRRQNPKKDIFLPSCSGGFSLGNFDSSPLLVRQLIVQLFGRFLLELLFGKAIQQVLQVFEQRLDVAVGNAVVQQLGDGFHQPVHFPDSYFGSDHLCSASAIRRFSGVRPH